MNLFIQQVEMPKMRLAYTISSSYTDAYQRIKNYLDLGGVDIANQKIYHAEIITMNSKIVFLYTDEIKNIIDYDKTEIQILSVEAGQYITLKVDKHYYQEILFENKELQALFNKDIEEYCKLHDVKQHMPAFPYLAHSTDGKEELFFPIKKNK
ncbi:MAG: hypothetical protein WC152_08335 [Candidatus Izemoplasmatales bacterium]